MRLLNSDFFTYWIVASLIIDSSLPSNNSPLALIFGILFGGILAFVYRLIMCVHEGVSNYRIRNENRTSVGNEVTIKCCC